MMLRMRRCKAFSLIELLLVIVLLSVIAGLTIPDFGRTYQKVALKQAVGDIVYLMRYAQSRAILSGHAQQIHFDTAQSRYWLTQSAAPEDGMSPARPEPVAGRMGKTFRLPDKVRLESPVSAIGFGPDGTIDKTRFLVCLKEECLTVSTQEQNGYVDIIEKKL